MMYYYNEDKITEEDIKILAGCRLKCSLRDIRDILIMHCGAVTICGHVCECKHVCYVFFCVCFCGVCVYVLCRALT